VLAGASRGQGATPPTIHEAQGQAATHVCCSTRRAGCGQRCFDLRPKALTLSLPVNPVMRVSSRCGHHSRPHSPPEIWWRAASSCRGGLRRFGLLAVIHRRRKLPLETISGVLCGGGATCRRRRNTASSPRNVLAGLEPPDQTGSAESSCRWRRFGLKPQPDQRRTHVALRSDHEHAGYWVSSMFTTTCGAAAYGSDLHLIIVAAKIVIA
jgi:hypothetical protein